MSSQARPEILVAVLHSLPPGKGTQTLRRVEMASRTLGCQSYSIANLYPAKLINTGALDAADADDETWQKGRDEISAALGLPSTTDVLLGYGVKTPGGPQRGHFRRQLDWLETKLHSMDVRVWTYGDRPAHPSRWQRVAFRHTPGSTPEVLASELLKLHTHS